jgi:hypothetical protein
MTSSLASLAPLPATLLRVDGALRRCACSAACAIGARAGGRLPDDDIPDAQAVGRVEQRQVVRIPRTMLRAATAGRPCPPMVSMTRLAAHDSPAAVRPHDRAVGGPVRAGRAATRSTRRRSAP